MKLLCFNVLRTFYGQRRRKVRRNYYEVCIIVVSRGNLIINYQDASSSGTIIFHLLTLHLYFSPILNFLTNIINYSITQTHLPLLISLILPYSTYFVRNLKIIFLFPRQTRIKPKLFDILKKSNEKQVSPTSRVDRLNFGR